MTCKYIKMSYTKTSQKSIQLSDHLIQSVKAFRMEAVRLHIKFYTFIMEYVFGFTYYQNQNIQDRVRTRKIHLRFHQMYVKHGLDVTIALVPSAHLREGLTIPPVRP